MLLHGTLLVEVSIFPEGAQLEINIPLPRICTKEKLKTGLYNKNSDFLPRKQPFDEFIQATFMHPLNQTAHLNEI